MHNNLTIIIVFRIFNDKLMHGYVLNKQSPLYGLANEIIKMQLIPFRYIGVALECDAVQAVKDYALSLAIGIGEN